MDNLRGQFEQITDPEFFNSVKGLEAKDLIFKEGEILTIKASRFRVEKIQKRKMVLKLLPQKE